jgi:hypothetical protein
VVESPAARADASAFMQANGYLKLTTFLSPALLPAVLDAIDRTAFYEREHRGIGRELCATPGPATGVLEFLLNDPRLFEVMRSITGCGAIGCFRGRVYRLTPSPGHYDSWHDDLGEQRLLACSINLGRDRFEGGELQIRRADDPEQYVEVANPHAGDAVLFTVDPAYQHRVVAVRGTVARTAYAGWFCSAPSYRAQLAAMLAGRDGSPLQD